MADDDVLKAVALIDEVHASVRLIEAGLGALQRINAADDFYHLPLLLLATGFERLMKCILCLSFRCETGTYPTYQYLKAHGHDLVQLLDEVVDRCFSEYADSRLCGQNDREMIRHDPRLRQLVVGLSDFAKSDRYYNLDVVVGRDQDGRVSAREQWEHIEMATLKELGLFGKIVENPSFDPFPQIIRHLVIAFERFARALCRLFTLANLGEEGSRMTGLIGGFLFLRDEQLGTRDYSNARHKRT